MTLLGRARIFSSSDGSGDTGQLESCNSQCGEQLQNCSCHSSCLNLQSCCIDYQKMCLKISPYSGTLMGGKDFKILHMTYTPGSNVTCWFNNETDTQGYVDQSGRAHCISPLLFQTGQIKFSLLFDGGNNFTPSGTWLAVHHSKASELEKSVLVDSKKWQYYGTPGYNRTLTMTWNISTLTTQHVHIEVWGYNETGEPYTESWQADWTYLYTLHPNHPNNGNFTFTPGPAESPFDTWDVGVLRITPSDKKSGERNVHAIWSPVHALAWHLSEHFKADPAAWATDKCLRWRDDEKNKLPDFLSETADCPCTLQQSRADIGRYHTDYGCNIDKGSVCTYHPGAVHCVRSIQASPRYAAGQQCCYDASGVQVLTNDSIGGSTPDRGHDWGSPPYRKPPRIPGFSHWLYDVITFYYCCLWSDNCQYYMELRPSSDCRTYKPSKVASAFGEPHIISFDGLSYTYKGKGEYDMVVSTKPNLRIQCRTSPYHGTKVKVGNFGSVPIQTVTILQDDNIRSRRSLPKKLNIAAISSVAMQEEDSDIIEVRMHDITINTLEVFVNKQIISFEEQSWMDMKGVFLFSPSPANVTVMFPSGAGVEVREIGGFLSLSVFLPEIFKDKTQGLLGVMNDNPADDFTLRNGTVLPTASSPEEIYQFGADWSVTNQTSLFLYDTQDLLEEYALKHDPDFIPTFYIEEDKNDTLFQEVENMCGNDTLCRFDAFTTRSLEIGNATKVSHQNHIMLVENLKPVVSCGWLGPPANGAKNGTTYLVGSTITFSCNSGFILDGSQQRTCQSDGMWSGAPAQCSLGTDNSCSMQCGQRLGQCSCHVTCENLGNCCTDYRTYCVRIAPESGLLMGGIDFVILGVAFNKNAVVKCRFDKEITVNGYVDEEGKAHCVSPLLYETGRIPFEMSVDGGETYPHSGTWLSVHPGKVSESEKCTLEDEKKWQYYGTPNFDGTLTVRWDSKTFKENTINIEVWGYGESGQPYSETWKATWDYLYTLVHKYANNGSYTFTPNPAMPEHRTYEFGSLRILPSQHADGEKDVHSLWSVDHAMAWHLGEDFRKDPASWAFDKCNKWHESDKLLPDFLSEIIDCPCTMEQARADTGRFHPDYGCNIDTGSTCTYHPGAVHCVRGIYGSPTYAAGQQCCYDKDGFQVLTSDSIGGSTPDRGHDWGSPPYKKPPRVPGFSHWLYDVISFYYCCLWSDNCDYYMKLRPSSDCRKYKPPKVASSFGDPHFITFDGSNFTFKGRGEYTLVSSTYHSLMIQGRTQAAKFENGSFTTVTGFSSVAMQEGNSDVIEVRLAADSKSLEVLLNQEVLHLDRTWMDLKGVFLFAASNQSITAMFSSGAGIEVRGQGGFISINNLLPYEFMNQTQGLMGKMNNDATDDFTFRNGTSLSTNAKPEEFFQLGANWQVTSDSSLFTYDSKYLLDNYKVKHDPDFLPTFSFKEDPNDQFTKDVDKLCGNDYFCRFDALTTRSLWVGNATKLTHGNYKKLIQVLQPVVSCGWLEPPKNGKKEGTSYLVDSNVKITCNKGYILKGSSSRKCQQDGKWSGETSHCVYNNTLGIVLGSVFGFFTLLVLSILIALHEKKHSRKKEISVPTVTYQKSIGL
ncbi:PREDICTED: sushi domain-containing protein 2 [Nanorana parkeri]|uniref:sushi domain-containing protein 2 n=1 Tax=Nanorana parkeri TaxID=125878 RepID=UPI0008542C38|nr:PREDICTED: sushi domain-containing protein 2 [Nanorana parkeri]